MEGKYWDHRATGELLNVQAANQSLAQCVMPQKNGLYIVRFIAHGSTFNKVRLLCRIRGETAPSLDSNLRTHVMSSTPAPLDWEIIVGPIMDPATSFAQLIILDPMSAGDTMEGSVFARFLGGIEFTVGLVGT